MSTCIYCVKVNTAPSIEHVVAEALGGALKLPAEAVCKSCNNNILGTLIDVPVRNDLLPILTAHGVAGKGAPATMTVAHPHPTEGERQYRVSQTDVVSAERRKLLARTGNTYEFRASSPEELEKVRREIAAKHPDNQVVLSDVHGRPLELPPDRLDEVDFTAPHWGRWAAKTCINLVAYAWGPDAARSPHFDHLRAHVMDANAPTPPGLRVGGCGSDTVNADELPAVHQIELTAAGDRVVVKMTSFAYCGFMYEGDAPAALSALARRIVLDAANGTVISDDIQLGALTESARRSRT